MKKALLIIVPVVLLLILGGTVIWNRRSKVPTINRPRINEQFNTVPLSQRVYTTLDFARESRFPVGRELVLTVAESVGAEEIEYELEYQAGTSVQGEQGSIFPDKEKFPYKNNILLGSCSAGGACSYHDDVKGGNVILRFLGTSYGSLKGEWNYYAAGNDGKFSSRDAKFQLTAPKLKPAFVLVSQTIGLPKPIMEEVVAGPYHVDVLGGSPQGVELTVHLSPESESAKLLRWTGNDYEEVKASLDNQTLAATLDSLGTFLVVR